jgi:hypothetical protein
MLTGSVELDSITTVVGMKAHGDLAPRSLHLQHARRIR